MFVNRSFLIFGNQTSQFGRTVQPFLDMLAESLGMDRLALVLRVWEVVGRLRVGRQLVAIAWVDRAPLLLDQLSPTSGQNKVNSRIWTRILHISIF